MGKAAGFLLILAGVGTAAYVVPAFDVKEEPRRAAPASSITTASIMPASQPTVSQPPLSQPAASQPAVAQPAPVARAAPQVEPIREQASVAKAKPLVAGASAPIKVENASEPIKVASGAPQRGDQRLALTKEIQRELRRVGCYVGDIDGEWSAETRQGMKTFIDRVNATLPIDQPDHILKTLVSGHPGDACGKSCPAGQTAAANGRCMPSQVIAQSPSQQTKRPADKAVAQARPDRAAPSRDATTPRDSTVQRDIAAVVPAPKVQPQKPASEAVVSSWAPTVVAAAVPPVAVPPAAVPQPRAEARPAELPGRMAVGVGADTEQPVAAPAPKAGSKIVIKRRDGVAAGVPSPAAQMPADVVAAPVAPRQKTAAIPPAEPTVVESESAPAAAPPRPSARKQGQPGVYRVPSAPPRYVGVYVSPPRVYSGYSASSGRGAFGPSIFKRLERDAR